MLGHLIGIWWPNVHLAEVTALNHRVGLHDCRSHLPRWGSCPNRHALVDSLASGQPLVLRNFLRNELAYCTLVEVDLLAIRDVVGIDLLSRHDLRVN